MLNIPQYALACYRALLWLYPPELRRSYGKEMTAVFEEVVRQEWTDRGVRGLMASGCRAFAELFTVAIPGQFASEWMTMVGLALAINLGIIVLEALFFVRRGF